MRIALAGRSGAGKTTMVRQLIQIFGGTELNFADPLKKIMTFIQDTCNIPYEKDRTLLQWIGTDWGRNKDELLWVNLLEKELESIEGNVFIGDLRFPNEMEMLKKHGFICIYISAGHCATEQMHAHISETSLSDKDNWDLIITREDIQGMFECLYNYINSI